MEPEDMKFVANLDQLRSAATKALNTMPEEDICDFFRTCASGKLYDMPTEWQLLAGTLAILKIAEIKNPETFNS